MTDLVITADTLLGMARQPTFSWMGSLEAVRLLSRGAATGCSTCGGRASSPNPTLDADTYRRVVTSGAFRSEAARLKTLLGYDTVQVIVDGSVTTL